jgi:UDP-N-acetylglucosamine 2-epimerase (non-hydrolysing)
MLEMEPVLDWFGPDVLIVVGDVNSTVACALTATKMGIRVAHVEAGLRSFDMTMPEEVNRLATDAISDFLFTTDRIADANLAREGVDPSRVFFVGNVMIDSLLRHLDKASTLEFAQSLGLEPGGYGTLTLHRPANVDCAERLGEILEAVCDGIGDLPVIFPIHPRTRQRIDSFGLSGRFAVAPGAPGIWLTGPRGYLEFLNLNAGARIVLTDSGGLQEETTVLGIPCVTLRENTERPITLSHGTNRLAGTRRKGILAAIASALDNSGDCPAPPENWDGRAAERIIEILMGSHGCQYAVA